jgi:hypothetical protein
MIEFLKIPDAQHFTFKAALNLCTNCLQYGNISAKIEGIGSWIKPKLFVN